MEQWKDVDGYEGYYQVSNEGRVKNSTKILNQYIQRYLRVGFYLNKTRKQFLVHRLVAKAFVPNPHNLEFVNHIDGNKENNVASNLEWCTRSENMQHAFRLSLRDNSYLRARRGTGKGYTYLKDRNKWRVMHYVDGKRVLFGYYDTEDQAAEAFSNIP